MASIVNPYKFLAKAGVVIPQYSEMRQYAEDMFREALGDGVDLSQQTAVGRLCEAFATTIMMCAKTNAQNAGNFNVRTAIGGYLDNIGGLFGIERMSEEGDGAYRSRILTSNSVGASFTESMRHAISEVDGVKSVLVLENPYGVARTVKQFYMTPHSFVAIVYGGDDTAIARAIYNTKSAGCANVITTASPSTPVISISDGATTTDVGFYRPSVQNISIEYSVSAYGFDGDEDELTEEANKLILESFNSHRYDEKGNVSAQDIIVDVANANAGITIISLSFVSGGYKSDSIGVYTNYYVNVESITPTVIY